MGKNKILSTQDEFEVNKVEGVYEAMNDLLESAGFKDVLETYYQQDLDNKSYKSIFSAKKKLDNQTTLKIECVIYTKGSPKETEEGLYGTLVIKLDAFLETKDPEESKYLKFMNKILRDVWWYMSYKKQYEYWEEASTDRIKKVMKKIREYYDLIAPVGKVKRMHYKPI